MSPPSLFHQARDRHSKIPRAPALVNTQRWLQRHASSSFNYYYYLVIQNIKKKSLSILFHLRVLTNVNDPDQSVFRITVISDYEVATSITELKTSKALDAFGLNTHFLKALISLICPTNML